MAFQLLNAEQEATWSFATTTPLAPMARQWQLEEFKHLKVSS